MLKIMVACGVFLLGFVPLINGGHIVLAVLWMVLWLAGCVVGFIKAKK